VTEATRPVLRIVRGVPDGVDAALEVAVLTAVLSARSRGGPPAELAAASAWNDPHRLVRSALRPGPDGWRASALPR
jgi:hypothetical protein